MLKDKAGVYVIKNMLNNKCYVGSTNNLERRKSEHKYYLSKQKHHCEPLQKDFDAYGSSCFEFKVLISTDSKDESENIEQSLLDCFHGDGLYNTRNTTIGWSTGKENHNSKYGISDSVKMKLSAKRKGTKMPEDVKKQISLTLTGKKKPEGFSENKRLWALGRWCDAETKEKLKESMRGKRKIIQCPHCGLSGGGGNMMRYHFNNCKKA